ncbi:MAG TPA: hypothetical protein PKX94_06195 [Opitutales bacterium]|nr:hypothetical protein [Opitutales bacterium]
MINTLVSSLEAVVDEAMWHISPDGIHVRAIDAASAAMVYIEIPSSEFDEIGYTGDIGIFLFELHKMMSFSKNDSDVRLDLSTTGKMQMVYDEFEYTIPLIDVSLIRKNSNMPNFDLPLKVQLPTAVFETGIKAVSKTGDYILIAYDAEKELVVISAERDSSCAKYTIDALSIDEYPKSNVKSLFAADYLYPIVKNLKSVSPATTLELGITMPAVLTSTIGENGTLTYIIAPRSED